MALVLRGFWNASGLSPRISQHIGPLGRDPFLRQAEDVEDGLPHRAVLLVAVGRDPMGGGCEAAMPPMIVAMSGGLS
jgi:hypothetical protein